MDLVKSKDRVADPDEVFTPPWLVEAMLDLVKAETERVDSRFAEGVRVDLSESAEEKGRTVRRLARQEAALVRHLDGGGARARAAELLPGAGGAERIAKYERHLHGLLTSTLHELERLQARREGEAVPPPAVADVNVTLDPGSG